VGYVVERADKSGQARYMAMFRDIKGQVHSAGTFHTSAAAEKAWQREEHRQQEGRITDPSRGRQTLRRYVEDEWFAHHMIEASTRQSYSYLLARYILPSFGGMKMREIMPIDVRRWVLKLQDQGVSPWSIRQCKGHPRRGLHHGVERPGHPAPSGQGSPHATGPAKGPSDHHG
jgi:Phage integrase, N-terminal SAM-like domain